VNLKGFSADQVSSESQGVWAADWELLVVRMWIVAPEASAVVQVWIVAPGEWAVVRMWIVALGM
jgi:hypothetical protein